MYKLRQLSARFTVHGEIRHQSTELVYGTVLLPTVQNTGITLLYKSVLKEREDNPSINVFIKKNQISYKEVSDSGDVQKWNTPIPHANTYTRRR